MFSRVLVIVCLGLAASGPAHATRYRKPPPPPPAPDVGAELAAAIRTKNAPRVAKLLGASVHSTGIWFADAACAKQFGAPGVVTGAALQPFARCLTQLRLQATTRQPGSTSSAVLTYEPGIELEIFHASGRVLGIGFEQQTAADRGRPTLTAQAFEALRKAGKTNLDDVVGDKLEPVLERAKLTSVSAWVKLCIDDQGALDQVTVRQTDAPAGPVQQKASTAFEVAMRGWRFRPFSLGGKPAAVCTMTLLTYPAGRAPLTETLPAASAPSMLTAEDDAEDESDLEGIEGGVEGGVVGGVVGGIISAPPPPPPPPPPQAVPPGLLEGNRISGDKNITPDDPTKTQIARSGKDKLVGSYKLCVDPQGAVTGVTMLKSTGFVDYDSKIMREMSQWAYRPYLVNGKAAPVCTAVTFIYSQPQPQPPPPPAPKPAKP